MKKTNIRALTESSIMIALSIVFGFVKLVDMPYGGSVTLASMLPIIIIAYRHGVGWGIGAALANSLVQLITGISYFSYFTTWQSIIALVLFDYIFAFAVFGLGGIFRGKLSQGAALSLGALLTSVVRYICHVISGATVWAGLSIPSGAALIYSFGYNATYMIPETLILLLVLALIILTVLLILILCALIILPALVLVLILVIHFALRSPPCEILQPQSAEHRLPCSSLGATILV